VCPVLLFLIVETLGFFIHYGESLQQAGAFASHAQVLIPGSYSGEYAPFDTFQLLLQLFVYDT
jgi:hypothetical protein